MNAQTPAEFVHNGFVFGVQPDPPFRKELHPDLKATGWFDPSYQPSEGPWGQSDIPVRASGRLAPQYGGFYFQFSFRRSGDLSITLYRDDPNAEIPEEVEEKDVPELRVAWMCGERQTTRSFFSDNPLTIAEAVTYIKNRLGEFVRTHSFH